MTIAVGVKTGTTPTTFLLFESHLMKIINIKMTISLGSGDLRMSSISICIFYAVFLGSHSDIHMSERVTADSFDSIFADDFLELEQLPELDVEDFTTFKLSPESGDK